MMKSLHNTSDSPETCRIKALSSSDLQNDDLLTPLQSLHVSSCAEVKPCQLRRIPQEFILAEQRIKCTRHSPDPQKKPLIKYICTVILESLNTCEGCVYWDSLKPTYLHDAFREQK